MSAPKPGARAGEVPLWRYARLFRSDILSAQPARLYRAKMAEFRTPFFRSYLLGEPALIREVLSVRPGDFPKSARVTEGLRPLLGRAVFVTNGADWARQRRIIDPAFRGGRLDDTFPAMLAAARTLENRLTEGVHEVEALASHAAADVIFRTLFSVPIGEAAATRVARAFARYQAVQPVLGLRALLPLPDWVPRLPRPRLARAARDIRELIGAMVAARAMLIREGRAPDDLATRIMTASDPVTGEALTAEEMADQVAIFFLAGHETSAAALAWALYLLAAHPVAQARAVAEAREFMAAPAPGRLRGMPFLRDVLRETLRLYPPVPMMVRESAGEEIFRRRRLRPGAQVVISPWHTHRNDRYWDDPDDFDPDRWARPEGRAAARGLPPVLARTARLSRRRLRDGRRGDFACGGARGLVSVARGRGSAPEGPADGPQRARHPVTDDAEDALTQRPLPVNPLLTFFFLSTACESPETCRDARACQLPVSCHVPGPGGPFVKCGAGYAQETCTCSRGGNGMAVIEDFEVSGPRLRIAVPDWRLRRAPRAVDPVPVRTAASRAEFERLMDRSTVPEELIHLRLTRVERLQRRQTLAVRAALYSSEFA